MSHRHTPSSASSETAVEDYQDQVITEYHQLSSASKPSSNPLNWPFLLLEFIGRLVYQVIQLCITLLFKPVPPKVSIPQNPYGRVAIIGAGLTGVATAAHFVSAGFDVVIFEEKEEVGGIWSVENKTSGLQLNSLMYRFFPTVRWSKSFPLRDEILEEIRKVWVEYRLQRRTRFNSPVYKVERHRTSTKPEEFGHARWVVNDGSEGVFDAVVACIGTCGTPKRLEIPGLDNFQGKVVHSSELDGLDLKGKNVIVVGSGASGVEACELGVHKGAKKMSMLARHDKWIIPRSILFTALLACQPFGRETPLSWIVEWYIRFRHYRSMKHLSPADLGIYEGTPIVNNEFLPHVKHGKVDYIRCDTQEATENGIRITKRERGTKPGDAGEDLEIQGDIVVLATGYERPSVDWLPEDLFPESEQGNYTRPNLYLGNFSTADWSVLLTNSGFEQGVGVVGNWHIGIEARILATFLMDPVTRPLPKDMKLWVDLIRFIKRDAPGGALTFFTYAELIIWLMTFHLFRWERLRWLPYIAFGWGLKPKASAVRKTIPN